MKKIIDTDNADKAVVIAIIKSPKTMYILNIKTPINPKIVSFAHFNMLIF